jgi:glypican 6
MNSFWVFFQSNYGNSGDPKPATSNRNKNSYAASSSSAAQTSATTDLEDTRLKNLIREIRETVGNAKRFWSKLPYSMCEEESKSNSDQSGSCWNGHEAGKYVATVVNDGLVSQEHNPEVSVDIGRPDVYINEQIFALKLITKKLESAHKGQNVDWPASISGEFDFFQLSVIKLQ